MGLAPVWRLRGPAAEPATGSVAVSDREQVANDAPAITDQGSRTSDNASRVPRQASPLDPRPPSPVPVDGDRRASIMALDWAALKDRVAGCTDCPLHQKRT